jgi:hypothetical protein
MKCAVHDQYLCKQLSLLSLFGLRSNWDAKPSRPSVTGCQFYVRKTKYDIKCKTCTDFNILLKNAMLFAEKLLPLEDRLTSRNSWIPSEQPIVSYLSMIHNVDTQVYLE